MNTPDLSTTRYEIEIKLPVTDLGAVREGLRSRGARQITDPHFESNDLYDQADGSIAKSGRVLLTRESPRVGIRGTLAGDDREKDMSFLDYSFAADLASDGKTLLFTDESESAGSNYVACLRKTDGSPVVRLSLPDGIEQRPAHFEDGAIQHEGVGTQPPQPSWGSMLNTAKNYVDNAPWMAIWPGLAIFLLWHYDAKVDSLIHLYVIGVFTAFTLSQAGMAKHPMRLPEPGWRMGLFINGTTILDWSANGRIWSRYGNRSPYKAAAPHGVYPCAGEDRWLAIACFAPLLPLANMARSAGSVHTRLSAPSAAHCDSGMIWLTPRCGASNG